MTNKQTPDWYTTQWKHSDKQTNIQKVNKQTNFRQKHPHQTTYTPQHLKLKIPLHSLCSLGLVNGAWLTLAATSAASPAFSALTSVHSVSTMVGATMQCDTLHSTRLHCTSLYNTKI